MIKNRTILLLCTVSALMLTACGSKSQAETTPSIQSTDQVNMANPFTDCKTLEEAEEAAGFSMTVPEDMPDGFDKEAIRVMKGKMIEIIYRDGEGQITIRKARGSQDISGDFNQYSENQELSVGDLQVTLKGNDKLVNIALWTAGDDTFSININPGGQGIDSALVSDLIKQIR